VATAADMQDLFACFGPVRLRPMFGAEGLFSGEVMFGFAQDDVVYLKTDEVTRPAFVAEGSKPFVYRKHNGEEIVMSYYPIPDRLYDDPEEFAQWAQRAYAVATRSPERKRRGSLPMTRRRARR